MTNAVRKTKARNDRPGIRAKGTPRSQAARRVLVLTATRKGAWLYHGDAARRTWRVNGPHLLGHIVNHLVLDPRDRRTLLAATKTGHLGPTIFRSMDFGRTWKEAARPPAFAKASEGTKGRVVDHIFWLTPCHANEPNVWYAGTSPQGLFRSEDGGNTWEPFSVINEDPLFRKWMGSAQDGTPDGPKLHSIIVDPRDPLHLYFSMSGGGVHESIDGGQSWTPIVQGLEVVNGFDPANIAFHDPRTACAFAPATQTGCINRITVAYTGSIDRHTSGNVSAEKCRNGLAISDFLWSCTRVTTKLSGYFQWTARQCGHAQVPKASRESM